MADGGSKQPCDVFELGRLRELIELMEAHELSEVELRQDNQRIRIARGVPWAAAALQPAGLRGAAMAATPSTEDGTAAAAPADQDVITINSPMVGTFYAQATPDSPPFVKVGDHVGPDTVVCIIEAMKVFNEIPAEISGKIVAVLVDNEDPVEFGKPLFKVETSK